MSRASLGFALSGGGAAPRSAPLWRIPRTRRREGDVRQRHPRTHERHPRRPPKPTRLCPRVLGVPGHTTYPKLPRNCKNCAHGAGGCPSDAPRPTVEHATTLLTETKQSVMFLVMLRMSAPLGPGPLLCRRRNDDWNPPGSGQPGGLCGESSYLHSSIHSSGPRGRQSGTGPQRGPRASGSRPTIRARLWWLVRTSRSSARVGAASHK